MNITKKSIAIVCTLFTVAICYIYSQKSTDTQTAAHVNPLHEDIVKKMLVVANSSALQNSIEQNMQSLAKTFATQLHAQLQPSQRTIIHQLLAEIRNIIIFLTAHIKQLNPYSTPLSDETKTALMERLMGIFPLVLPFIMAWPQVTPTTQMDEQQTTAFINIAQKTIKQMIAALQQ